MARDLDTLIELIGRDASSVMAQAVPSRALVAETLRQLFDEPNLVAQAVIGHPALQEAAEAVAQDVDLARIITVGATGPMLIAANAAPRLSARGLVAEAFGSAAAELRCRGILPSAEALTAMALRNVERLRLIGRNAPTEVVTFLGFSSISLPEAQELELPWGKVSTPVGFYGMAEFTPTGRPTSTVLVAEHALKVEIDDKSAGIGPVVPKPIVDHNDWIQLTTRLVSLAVVLGTPRARVAPVPTFQFTLLPYETPISAYHHLVLAPPAVERRLEPDECAEIERWARILGERYSPRLEVAARRVIAGLSQRLDPADRLIDAVIAWESLFGADQEATLRVTGSLSWLLESDIPTNREVLRLETARIYGLRSRVVHGRQEDPIAVSSASTRATEVAIIALAALLERRPDLIKLDSGERSRRLLLGIPAEPA
jgi:hypothetical protein